MALSGLPPAVSGPGDAAAQPPARERFEQDADRLRGVLRSIPDEVARSRELLRQRLEAVGGTPPPLVTSSYVVSRDTADVPVLKAEIRRLDAQWQRERAAWQAAEAAATRKAAPPEPANRPLRKRKRPPAPAEGFRRGARAKEDFAAAGRVVEEASESVECWACEREFPRLVKGKVSRVAKGGVCKDCLVCPPGGNAGFRREQGAVDFEAVRGLVEEACRGNRWIKGEQAPHVSDYLAHLVAASFANSERCKQTPAGYTFLERSFPHPNGHTRKRTQIAKSIVDALGPKVSLQIFGIILWRYHNTEDAWAALKPLLLKFSEGEDLQVLRQGVEAMYLDDPAKARLKSHLFSTGDAIRSTGGHASWRAAVIGSLRQWWEAAQCAAAILEDPATTPAIWHRRFREEVLAKLPCFGPYWSKYVYGDISEHIAGDKADLQVFTMVGPGCLYWLRFMGLPLRQGSQQATPALEALRELRDVVNKVLESGQHAGLERARAEAQLGLLTVYDLQVQSCECKRGFCLVPRVAKARPLLEHAQRHKQK